MQSFLNMTSCKQKHGLPYFCCQILSVKLFTIYPFSVTSFFHAVVKTPSTLLVCSPSLFYCCCISSQPLRSHSKGCRHENRLEIFVANIGHTHEFHFSKNKLQDLCHHLNTPVFQEMITVNPFMI